MEQTSVVIIGAGISGLALAQALHRRNVSFRLFERDPSLHARAQGYRVRISDPGIEALERSLLPERFERLQTLCPAASAPIGNAAALYLDAPSGEPTVSPFQRMFQGMANKNISLAGNPLVADRSLLRQALSEGLGDSLSFGVEYERHEEIDEGVIVYLKNHPSIRCQVLIGGDGLWSKVRRPLIPDFSFCDTAGRIVYAKTILSETMLAQFSPSILQTAGMTFLRDDTKGLNCLLEPMRFDHTQPELPEDYVYWVLFLPTAGENDDELLKLSGNQLREKIQTLTGNWHPSIRCLFDTPHMTLSRVITSRPQIPSWDSNSRVTLMGDAIHAMPPTAAFGATTALQDVGVLADKLSNVAEAQWTVKSLREYEAEMREYASASIMRSAQGGKMMFGMKDFEELSTVVPS